MFTRSLAPALLLAALLGAGPALATDTPRLGKPISAADAAAWDISIGPDGAGLPPGSGNAAQGAPIFAAKCAVCHGEKGEGKIANRLVGGIGTLSGPKEAIKTVGSYWPYATTLFDYVRRSMPWNQPKTLSDDEVYAVSAYILALNGIIKDGDVMNKDTLVKVAMPNRDGFIPLYPNKH
jgi:mono/diheme cytochrome c family protein